MSLFGLRGRKFLDALQHHPSFPGSRFRLPCPPYDNPAYWDQLYKGMTYDMVNEWGDVDLCSALMQFNYQVVSIFHGESTDDVLAIDNDNSSRRQIISTTTFANWMDITQLSTPEEAMQAYLQQQQQYRHHNSSSNSKTNEAILILGCGNSKLGEQLLINSFIGPILQLDVSSKVMQLMTQRYQKYLSQASVKRMEFLVDDATTGLTSVEPESVGGGVIDKGLLDVLHCSLGRISSSSEEREGDDDNEDCRDNNMIQKIMSSVHNVLQPSRPFVFFSRSEPQWMLRRVFGHDDYYDLVTGGYISRSNRQQQRQRKRKRLWKDVKVVKLLDHDLFLYKIVKADGE